MSISSPVKPQNRDPDENENLVKQFLELQKQDLAYKREELASRTEKIHSDERIAIESIKAQKESDLKHGEMFQAIYKTRWRCIVFMIFVSAVVILGAIYLHKADVSLEVIKTGGAVLLGYLTGVYRGKVQILEKQKKDSTEG